MSLWLTIRFSCCCCRSAENVSLPSYSRSTLKKEIERAAHLILFLCSPFSIAVFLFSFFLFYATSTTDCVVGCDDQVVIRLLHCLLRRWSKRRAGGLYSWSLVNQTANRTSDSRVVSLVLVLMGTFCLLSPSLVLFAIVLSSVYFESDIYRDNTPMAFVCRSLLTQGWIIITICPFSKWRVNAALRRRPFFVIVFRQCICFEPSIKHVRDKRCCWWLSADTEQNYNCWAILVSNVILSSNLLARRRAIVVLRQSVMEQSRNAARGCCCGRTRAVRYNVHTLRPTNVREMGPIFRPYRQHMLRLYTFLPSSYPSSSSFLFALLLLLRILSILSAVAFSTEKKRAP